MILLTAVAIYFINSFQAAMAGAMLEISFNACLEDTFEDTEEELVGVEEDEVSEDN